MAPPQLPPLPHRATGGFPEVLGLVYDEIGDGLMRAHFEVRDELLQPAGLLHGGVLASVAETLASFATFLAVKEKGDTAMGLSNHTSFLRPITKGEVTAQARARHRGRSTWVWDVDFADDGGRLCATTRMTIAVRPS